MSEFSVILFHSTNYSIKASNVLKKNNIEHKMIPVPRHLSSDCGYCVKIGSMDSDKVREIFDNNGVEFDSFEKL
jgi:hypothetical protein